MFYSAQTGGFYDEAIHGANIPADSVEISREQHAALMAAQAVGKVIIPDESGAPIAVDAPPETPEQAIARLKAEIKEIEVRDLMNRRAREAFIVQAEAIAAEQFGMTPEQLYLANPGYKGAKDIDNQIAQLRAQIGALEDQL